ncbi:Proline iminopeptidase [Streptomyces sp. RB5]|uniref:Proline iminopeptidase n=1 Tax=Streptomyces smaragdinus TaxID=2585196 RepID=A0A7K0CCR4_9ACTN|nr:alpha/beta hydrolase [Streptomyces smaragdinus]MQY11143.1 Proline iminopeptidase [Streptomyces smaragdinus]
MTSFQAPDGTSLAYDEHGEGAPLVCLPGGPMQDPGYLGELGGLLPRHRRLVVLHARGTGRSAEPADPGTYRCDRQVGDVEAFRAALDVDRMDLLAHSAGTNLALLYAVRYPRYVRSLVLVAPSAAAVDLHPSDEVRREVARLRAKEPWFDEAWAALTDLQAGTVTPDTITAIAPFRYGRWNADARAHAQAEDKQRNAVAAAGFNAEGAYDPAGLRAALGSLSVPVLLVAGELDVNSPPAAVAEQAALFPDARLVVQPGAGHFPWLDDPEAFTATVADFLAEVS